VAALAVAGAGGAGVRELCDDFEVAGIKASFESWGDWSLFHLHVRNSDLPKLGGAVCVQERFRDMFGEDALQPTADAHSTTFLASRVATHVEARFLGLKFLVTKLARELWRRTPGPPKLNRFKEDVGHAGIRASCFTGGGFSYFTLIVNNDELRELGNVFRNDEIRKADGIFYVQEQLRHIFGDRVIRPSTGAQKTVFAAIPEKPNRATTDVQFSAVQSLVEGLARTLRATVTPCSKPLGSKAPAKKALGDKELDRLEDALKSCNKKLGGKAPGEKTQGSRALDRHKQTVTSCSILASKAPCNEARGRGSKAPCDKTQPCNSALGSKAPRDKTRGSRVLDRLKKTVTSCNIIDGKEPCNKALGGQAPGDKTQGSRALDGRKQTVTSFSKLDSKAPRNKARGSTLLCNNAQGRKAPRDITLALECLQKAVTLCNRLLDSKAFVRHHSEPAVRKLGAARSFVAQALARPKRAERREQAWDPVFLPAPRRTKKRG